MNAPTPSTEARSADHIGFWSCATVPTDFARKLERERDEAQRVLREQHAQIIGCYALEAELRNERDQLRKEVEKAFAEGWMQEESTGCFEPDYKRSRAKRVAEGGSVL